MFSLYTTILILGFMSGVYTETCPVKEAIHPCECEENRSGDIMVSCYSVLSIKMRELETLQQAFSSLAGKSNIHLQLSLFNTSKFPSNLFSGIGIKKLDLASCHVDSLTNDDQPALLGLQNYLEELLIRVSRTVPAKLNLGPLKKLKKIQLSHNKMTELRDDWLSNGQSSLETLYIFENKIEKIRSNVFSELSNLQTLWLTGNRLGHIERSMFPTTADKLESLNLENNALTDLPEDLFSRMPSLTSVSLDGNGITTLDERTWSPVWQQLWTLDVSGNNIYCDDRLNWISKSKKRPRVFGYCSSPKEFEKWDLEQFFETRSQ